MIDHERLRRSVLWSIGQMRTARADRLRIIRQFVGRNYGRDRSMEKITIPLIYSAIRVYTQILSPRNPRCYWTCRSGSNELPAKLLELACNQFSQKYGLGRVIRRAIRDALISVGAVRVGLQMGESPKQDTGRFDYGEVYAESVDLDDLILDMHAEHLTDVQYIGRTFLVPLQEMIEHAREGHYDPEVVRKVETASLSDQLEGGDRRISSITDARNEDTRYRKDIRIAEIFDTYHGVLVDMVLDSDLPPLREVSWNGPAKGPFHLLYFEEVPGNVLPLAPAAHWVDIAELINRLHVKEGRRALRHKRVTIGRKGHEKDSERIARARDGEFVGLDNPAESREVEYGGISNSSLAFLSDAVNRFSMSAGNLELLAGLGPQSQTARQDLLLNENSNRLIQEMQACVENFVRDIFRDVGWWFWTSPIPIPLTWTDPVFGWSFETLEISPETRKGDFLDYNVQILPFSKSLESPQSRAQELVRLVTSLIIPTSQLWAGKIEFKIDELFRILKEVYDWPELDRILQINSLPSAAGHVMPESSKPKPPPRPSVTLRQYERIGRPGGTPQSQNVQMAQAWLGAETE